MTKVCSSNTKFYISEEKRKEIMRHVDKKLSSVPQTLSALLSGVSYAPNTMSFIRKMVEGRKDVDQKAAGKRVLYFRRSSK